MSKDPQTVDAYISAFPVSMREKLQQLRTLIQTHAPQATEGMAYGMPAYKLNNKPLVYFGGFPQHIGFYALPTGHAQFAPQLAQYKHGKGSVQFPLNQELPEGLIVEMVKFRVETLS